MSGFVPLPNLQRILHLIIKLTLMLPVMCLLCHFGAFFP